MIFLKTSVLLFYYKLAPMGKIFFKILKMGDSYQRQWQTLLPGGQTTTKCEIIYFDNFERFFILYVSIIVVNRDKLAWLWSRIALLSDHPRGRFYTFWNPQDKTFP